MSSDYNTIEEWRDISGFEGLYKISSLGQVYSLRSKRLLKPCLVGPLDRDARYYGVMLRKDGKAIQFTIHRLVALAFIGERPDGHYINHKNLNRLDNRVDNLEYVTPQENTRHAIANGVKFGQGVKRNRNLKIP